MSEGIYFVKESDFVEIGEKYFIGKDDSCDRSLEGKLAPRQLMFKKVEETVFLQNLDSKIEVSLNGKIMPEGIALPLKDLSMIRVDDKRLIYSKNGPLKKFRVDEVVSKDKEMEPSIYVESKLDFVRKIQKELESARAASSEMILELEDIKRKIQDILKERESYRLKVQEQDDKIDQLKSLFEEKKSHPSFSAFASKKNQLLMKLNELAEEKGNSLELDI